MKRVDRKPVATVIPLKQSRRPRHAATRRSVSVAECKSPRISLVDADGRVDDSELMQLRARLLRMIIENERIRRDDNRAS